MAEYIIEENDAGRRIDRVLRRFLSNASLSSIYSSIRKGFIRLNSKKVAPSRLTVLGDVLYVDDRLIKHKNHGIKVGVKERKLSCNLDILLKTHNLLFVNKPIGIATHGKKSLDEEVKRGFACDSSLSFSIGPLHRLDKNTSGIVTFSQSLKGANVFSQSLRCGDVFRFYFGINEGYVENAIWAINQEETEVFLLEYSKEFDLSLVVYRLITGKKHQIRRGALYFDRPLFCDCMYGSLKRDYSSYFLHAFAICFHKQLFYDVPHFVLAPLPRRFYSFIIAHFPITGHSFNNMSENNAFLSILDMFSI